MADINIGQISEALNEKMDRNLSNTDAIGQAILDGKVEVEALLEQNGYAKFTWKNGNKISKLIFCWGYDARGTKATVTLSLPYTFNKILIPIQSIITTNTDAASYNMLSFYSVTTSTIQLRRFSLSDKYYMIVGT